MLGPGYTATRIPLGSDAEGPLLATVVHRDPVGPTPAGSLLVLHGWSDYVFHRPLLEAMAARGFDVWALDLRKYGRSLLPGQTPTAIGDLDEYDRELSCVLEHIGQGRPPVVLAHSAGGLIAALWAVRRPWTVRGLILNSPWLEMHLGPVARRMIAPVAAALAWARPSAGLPRGDDHYARIIHREHGGLHDFDLALKPAGGHRMPVETFDAVLEGQRRLREAGPLPLPVLVLHSSRSRWRPRFDERMRRADVVLDVHSLAVAAARLGPRVRTVALDGAVHDVFLSGRAVRAEALAAVDRWLDEELAVPRTMRPSAGAPSPGDPPTEL